MTIDTSTLLPLGLVISLVSWAMVSAYAYGKMVGKIEEMAKRVKELEDKSHADMKTAVHDEGRLSRIETHIGNIFIQIKELVQQRSRS